MALRKFVFQAGEFFEEQATTDELDLGKLTLSGLSGVSLDGGAARAENFANPTSDQHLATKAYVDGVATGLDPKGSVRLATVAALPANTAAGSGIGKTLTMDAVGILPVDGVNSVLNDDILVKDEATASDNGIYTVTTEGTAGVAAVLTRRTDFDQDAEVTAGAHTFVAEGATLSDTGWVLSTNDPITVDTTGLAFVQFSSAGVILGGAGLLKTGNVLDVRFGDGIENVADFVTVDISATPGLEFTGSTPNAELQVLVDPNGGIERVAAGIGALLDSDSLQKSSSGLLAASIEEDLVANENLNLGDPVAYSATNNEVAQGDATNDADSRIIGIAEAAATATNPVRIVRRGPAQGVLSAATVNTPFFLAAGGGLTTTPPSGSGNRVIRVGFAKNATDLEVIIADLGKKS